MAMGRPRTLKDEFATLEARGRVEDELAALKKRVAERGSAA